MAVNYAPPPEIIEEVEYPASDGKPMGETGFHIKLIVYVVSLLETYYRHRTDVYVGGDMFVYYEEGDPRRCFAPDVFVAFGVSNKERRSWFTWKENKVPEVIFEFTSKETREEDLWTKRGLYQWLGVKEYFLFDPLDEYLKPCLQGFRLTDGVYQAVPEINYGLQSESLGLTLNANGNRLALTETATGKRLLQLHELQEAYQSAEKEIEKLRNELERLKKQK
ncbi:MAG: Uma2 family endonuclease [Chloroflexi bacterium]|nr:Uma2 family endonuclease [Chloroflexota bacterium]